MAIEAELRDGVAEGAHFRSLCLDALNFLLADVRGALGPLNSAETMSVLNSRQRRSVVSMRY